MHGGDEEGVVAAQKEGVMYLMGSISTSKLERIVRNLPTALAQVSRHKAANMKRVLLALKKEVAKEGKLVVEYLRSVGAEHRAALGLEVGRHGEAAALRAGRQQVAGRGHGQCRPHAAPSDMCGARLPG